MRGLDASGLPASSAEAVDDIEHALRQQVADDFRPDQNRGRRLLGRLEDDAVAGRKRRRELPRRHQDREVPRNDLPDHAERLMKVIGDGVVVDLADRAFLGADAGGEIAEMIDRQRHVGGHGLADRLAVVPGLRLASSSRLSSIRCAIFMRMFERSVADVLAPAVLGGVAPHRCAALMSFSSERGMSQSLPPVTGVMFSKYLPEIGSRHSPPI